MPESLKVLIFIKGLDLGGYSGGADLFGANLACQLDKHGIEVTLCVCYKFNTKAENEILSSLLTSGITPNFLLEWSGHPGVRGYIDALRKLNYYLEEHPINIIHSHFHTGTLLSVLLKQFGKVRWVVRTAHVDQEWTRGWRGLIRQSIIRILIFVIFPLFVDLEAGVSSNSVEILNQRFIAKVFNKYAMVIHNAIPIPDGFDLSVRQKDYTGWQGNHPIVGSIGRLEEQKGYEYLLAAIPEVLLQYPSLETWLIGDGQLNNKLKEQSEMFGIRDHVVFWGKQNKIPVLLSKMDLFVSSSLYEGLPTVVLEAMMYGIPCVVTDIPGTRDITQEKNVVVIPAGDSKALAGAICHVLGTPSLRQTLVENAVQTVKRFCIENISLEYLDAYRKL